MKKNYSTILLILIFVTGLSLLLYPTFADYWNSLHQSRAIASYTESVVKIDNSKYEKMLAEARSYNERLAEREFMLQMTDEEIEEYNSVLDVGGTGIMASIEIPSIDVELPVYHGTDEGVLQIAIGHIAGTSLPVGGENTHSVLSGHRGLPSAKLFTNIDKLTVGDEFMIHTLDEVLTYEVDQILIVLPHEIDDIKIVPGEDLCTLVTCTPYGVNSHRLLVRGRRTETIERHTIRVPADAVQIEPVMVAPILITPMLLLTLIWLVLPGKPKKKRQ